MTSPFPQESREIYSRLVAAEKLHNPKRKPYQAALSVMRWAENVPYGFEDNLLTGNYAPWPHELHSGKITGYNCTTIIPEIYLVSEEYGLKPEIVQFIHCKNKKKDEKEYFFESHFAIIVDIGKTQPYLIDPFQGIMGPIKHRDKHSMVVGSYNDYPSVRREYNQLLTYSPKEFVVLMELLRQPADSLDMLVAGQKLYKHRLVNSVKCDLMIYYDDHKNMISTRLDIPQVARQSKVIHYFLPASERGEFEEGSLEFSYANKFGWKDLQGEVKLARLNHSEIRQLGRYCSKIANKSSRLGSEFVSEFKSQLESQLLLSSISQVNIPTDKQVKDNLCSLAETLWRRLSSKEQTSLEQKIIARTLYEGTHLERDYHFPEEERKKKLMDLLEKNRDIHSLIEPLKDILHDHNWKLDRLSLKESRQIRSRYLSLEKKKEDLLEKIKDFKNLYYFSKKEYARVMDQVLFAEHLKPLSTQERRKAIEHYGLDTRLGYISMVADFLPYALKARRDLELDIFRPKIEEKIKDRIKDRTKLMIKDSGGRNFEKKKKK